MVIVKLYNFQKQAVADLDNGSHICLLPTGAGKTAVMFNWLKHTGKKKVVIITTATKAKSGDMQREALMWNDPFEGVAIVARTVVNEYYYTNFTDRQYILKGGVRTYWNGNPVNNADCTDEQLAQYLQEGLEPLLFLTYPGKE